MGVKIDAPKSGPKIDKKRRKLSLKYDAKIGAKN
jgi:hypothetical protein